MPRIRLADLKPKTWSTRERDRIDAVTEATIERAIAEEPLLDAYSAADVSEALRNGHGDLASRMDRVSEATRKRRDDLYDGDDAPPKSATRT